MEVFHSILLRGRKCLVIVLIALLIAISCTHAAEPLASEHIHTHPSLVGEPLVKETSEDAFQKVVDSIKIVTYTHPPVTTDDNVELESEQPTPPVPSEPQIPEQQQTDGESPEEENIPLVNGIRLETENAKDQEELGQNTLSLEIQSDSSEAKVVVSSIPNSQFLFSPVAPLTANVRSSVGGEILHSEEEYENDTDTAEYEPDGRVVQTIQIDPSSSYVTPLEVETEIPGMTDEVQNLEQPQQSSEETEHLSANHTHTHPNPLLEPEPVVVVNTETEEESVFQKVVEGTDSPVFASDVETQTLEPVTPVVDEAQSQIPEDQQQQNAEEQQEQNLEETLPPIDEPTPEVQPEVEEVVASDVVETQTQTPESVIPVVDEAQPESQIPEEQQQYQNLEETFPLVDEAENDTTTAPEFQPEVEEVFASNVETQTPEPIIPVVEDQEAQAQIPEEQQQLNLEETIPLVHEAYEDTITIPEVVQPEVEDIHDHTHHHHHEHHEHEALPGSESDEDNTQFVSVLKHLSYTLISFLPEHLQDTILDVNDALILTGIIALTLVSICVPYFFIETYMAVYPLKKKVVELNRNLWKVSTAYDNQQEDYEAYKTKALAYDEDKDKIEKLETELHLVKQLDIKNQSLIKKLQKDMRYSTKVATEVEGLVEKTMNERETASAELEKVKSYLVTVQAKLKQSTEALESSKAESAESAINIEVLTHANSLLERKINALEDDILNSEAVIKLEEGKRKSVQSEADKYEEERDSLQRELRDLKTILHQYEETASSLSQEISLKENELMSLKESLGEDSPLVEAAELVSKLKASEENATALQSRVDSLSLENDSLSQNLSLLKTSVGTLDGEKKQAENKFVVLESYFKQKEEELRTMVEKYETEKKTRGMDKEGLISLIEEKEDEIRELNHQIEEIKQELEDTKTSHRNEIRSMESKQHENWLLLCQSERKLQEARKNGDVLRQKLTAVTREKDDGEGMDEMDGDLKMSFFPLIPSDLIPVPLPEDDLGATYIGLGNFMPPPPLEDEDDVGLSNVEREPSRPPPLGRLSPTFSDHGMNGQLSPITPRGFEYSSGSSSPPHHRRPPSRDSWMNGNGIDHGSEMNNTTSNRRHRGPPPRTSSPINHGVNV